LEWFYSRYFISREKRMNTCQVDGLVVQLPQTLLRLATLVTGHDNV
jgi:hypothetical protein